MFNPQVLYSAPDEYYLPYAADSIYHRPLPGVTKIYDVCIIGSYYENRVELIKRLREAGFQCFFQLGLAKHDAQLVMNQSTICVNWSSRDDMTARVFEAMSTGIVLLANRVPALQSMFVEDDQFVAFSSMAEAVDKVRGIVSDPQRSARIAGSGREAIETGRHFWDDRLSTILGVCGVR